VRNEEVLQSQWGEKHPTNYKKKEGRKKGKKNKSDRKTRKKT
jgi:hypothetical protein